MYTENPAIVAGLGRGSADEEDKRTPDRVKMLRPFRSRRKHDRQLLQGVQQAGRVYMNRSSRQPRMLPNREATRLMGMASLSFLISVPEK